MLLRRKGAELGTLPLEWLRRPTLLPPGHQGTEKSHHFFGLCGGSACEVGGRAEGLEPPQLVGLIVFF